MTKPYLFLALLSLLACSCNTPSQEAIYQIDEPYDAVKGKLVGYYESQKQPLSLIQDEITYRPKDVVPGRKSTYTLLQSAPDIGTRPRHVSRLTKSGKATSKLEVFAPRIEHFGTSPAARIKDIDQWATSSLKVTSRFIGPVQPR